MTTQKIRPESLRPAAEWEQPTGEEVAEVIRMCGFTGTDAAAYLGLGPSGGRTVRKWVGNEARIPYSAWALLCDKAGLGQFWK